MNRPLGSHIPQTWPELLQLAKDEETDQILRQPAYVKALRAVCALCGRQCSRPGALIQRHQQDHAILVNEAAARSLNLQNQATAVGRPCHCGNRIVKKEHRCVVFQQIAMLQVIAHKENTSPPHVTPSAPSSLPLHQVKFDDELQHYWDDPDLRTSRTTTCQLCKILLPLAEVEAHLMTSHATLGARALELYATCTSLILTAAAIA